MAEIYTKDDYLTPTEYAKRYNVPVANVIAAVERARRNHASISRERGGGKQEIIITNKGRHRIRPEEAAHTTLNTIIEQMKGYQQ